MVEDTHVHVPVVECPTSGRQWDMVSLLERITSAPPAHTSGAESDQYMGGVDPFPMLSSTPHPERKQLQLRTSVRATIGANLALLTTRSDR